MSTACVGLQAFLDAAICFFVPFLAASPLGNRSSIDVFSVGKTIFTCMLGVVTMEIMIVARYWTWWFAAVCALSYLLVYPYVIFFPIFWQNVFGTWDLESSGVGINIMATPFFWIALLTVYSMTFSIRYDPAHKQFLRSDLEGKPSGCSSFVCPRILKQGSSTGTLSGH